MTRPFLLIPLTLALLFALATPAGAAPLAIDAKYPGGNIIVEKIEGDTVFLKPDLRDTKGWWFYWNFRVTGAAGRTLHFRFSKDNPIGVRGPARSRDGGLTWTWLGAQVVKELKQTPPAWEFSYAFRSDGEVRFSFCIPYLQANLERFLAGHKGNPALVKEELCISRKGRSVECLRVGKVSGEPKFRILLTARHHACESMADYEMEGVLEAVLENSAAGRLWRANVEVLAVPFMDKDGVEDGDQGKNRIPHDHNRDYNETSLYPEVAALRAKAPVWSGGKLVVALDLHCPHIRGGTNEHIYFVGGEDQELWTRVTEFSRLLESTRTGPLPYRVAGNVPFGTAWNTATNYDQGKSCGSWARELPGIRLASGIELPYANVQGAEVTADSARAWGCDLARALAKYLALGE